MTWHLSRIPKRAFFFWGTESLPWVRYLTLETFRKHHPDWEMFLYRLPVLQKNTTNYNAVDCWPKVNTLNIKIEEIDIEKQLGVEFPCKFITIYADIFRYIVLWKYGGFYADMDHLFFRSLEQGPFNIPSNAERNVFLISPPYHHFIFGVPNASWYDKVLKQQILSLPKDVTTFLDTTACTEKVPIQASDRVYRLPAVVTEDNFRANGPTNDNAIALNWHGSGIDRKYNMVTEENYMTSDHPLAACIRYCLTGVIGDSNGVGSFPWIARYE